MAAFDLRNALYLDGVIIAGPGGLRGNAPNPAGGGGGPTVPLSFVTSMAWTGHDTTTVTSGATTIVVANASAYVLAFIAMCRHPANAGTIVSSVTSTSSLVFSLLDTTNGTVTADYHQRIEIWGAPTSGALAGEQIIFHLSGGNNGAACVAAAFYGAVGTSGVYTPDGPPQDDFNASSIPSVVLNTVGSNDLLVFAAGGVGAVGNSAAPTGWTLDNGTTSTGGGARVVHAAFSHKIVAAPQTALTVQPSGVTAGRGACIGLALKGM